MEFALGGEGGAAVGLHDLADVGGVLDFFEGDLVDGLRAGRAVDVEQLFLIDAVLGGFFVDGMLDGVFAVLGDVGAEAFTRLCLQRT